MNLTKGSYQLLELSHTQGQLTDEQLFWLQCLLNLSQTNNLVKIKKIEEHKYDYKTECNSVLQFLLDKTVNSEGRITSSTEFGNFVSNLSFQHGIAGLLFPLNKLYPQNWILKYSLSSRRQ